MLHIIRSRVFILCCYQSALNAVRCLQYQRHRPGYYLNH